MLFSVPSICEPLACQPINLCVEFDHLSQLQLADSSDSEARMEVDILIGSDYYWELTTGRTRRGKSGPVAIYTKLGWVLSGPVHSPEINQASVTLISTHTLRVGS